MVKQKSREHAAKTIVQRKIMGKSTCNGCMTTTTVYPKTIDGITYLYCENCKG